jgi:hypothetical protein
MLLLDLVNYHILQGFPPITGGFLQIFHGRYMQRHLILLGLIILITFVDYSKLWSSSFENIDLFSNTFNRYEIWVTNCGKYFVYGHLVQCRVVSWVVNNISEESSASVFRIWLYKSAMNHFTLRVRFHNVKNKNYITHNDSEAIGSSMMTPRQTALMSSVSIWMKPLATGGLDVEALTYLHLEIVTASNYRAIANTHTLQVTTARTGSSHSAVSSPVVAW